MESSRKPRGAVVEEVRTGWYLIFTKSKDEITAEQNLKRQGFQIYLPFIQQHRRKQNVYQIVNDPLFPRYLFVHLTSGADDWSKIRSTRGCITLVRFGVYPARVPDALIQQLKQEEQARLLHPTTKTPNFKPGDKVQIIDGVLANYQGIVGIKNSQQRITLLLQIAEGHTRSVNVSVHQIKMAD